jgi:hypothetical protein
MNVTYVDHRADITHQPRFTLHALLGVLAEFDVVWDLALGSELFTAGCQLPRMLD